MLFRRLAGVFCSQFRSLTLFIVNFWCFIWYSAHFAFWHAEKTSLSKCQLYGLCCQDVRFALFSTVLGRGCVLCSQFVGVSTVYVLDKHEEEIDMYPKSQFKLKNIYILNLKIYEGVNFELWLERSHWSFLCLLHISISIVNPLQSSNQTVMWNVLLSLQEACQLGKITSVNVSLFSAPSCMCISIIKMSICFLFSHVTA